MIDVDKDSVTYEKGVSSITGEVCGDLVNVWIWNRESVSIDIDKKEFEEWLVKMLEKVREGE